MSTPPKFICDDHCGRLARWLRFLGYDCLYERDIDDNALLKTAAGENRIILTRDSQIAGMALARTVVLLTSPAPLAQLREVIEATALTVDWDQIGTRCSVCNGSAAVVPLVDIAERVPPYVQQTQSAFRECIGCRRIYWHGTHVKNMIKELCAAGLLERPCDGK